MPHCLLVLLAVLGLIDCAYAQADKYHATAAEKIACTPDAVRLCMAAYPDEDRLIACMKENRNALSANCRDAFGKVDPRQAPHPAP